MLPHADELLYLACGSRITLGCGFTSTWLKKSRYPVTRPIDAQPTAPAPGVSLNVQTRITDRRCVGMATPDREPNDRFCGPPLREGASFDAQKDRIGHHR